MTTATRARYTLEFKEEAVRPASFRPGLAVRQSDFQARARSAKRHVTLGIRLKLIAAKYRSGGWRVFERADAVRVVIVDHRTQVPL